MYLYVQTSAATLLMLMVCSFELQGFNLHLNVQTSAALLTMHILRIARVQYACSQCSNSSGNIVDADGLFD